MKKLSLIIISAFILISASAYARDIKVSGTVTAVNTKNQQITIQNVDGENIIFAVVPSTEIEFENRFMDNAKFSDLRVGQYVKVEYIPGTTKTLVAEEIDIYTGPSSY